MLKYIKSITINYSVMVFNVKICNGKCRRYSVSQCSAVLYTARLLKLRTVYLDEICSYHMELRPIFANILYMTLTVLRTDNCGCFIT
jgi:hypothetical protein